MQPSIDWFNSEFWQTNNWITGSSFGRNKTYFCRYPLSDTRAIDIVLRHYYRGGMVGKIIHDQYQFSSIEKTRPYRELKILETVRELQLPAPIPIGGYVIKQHGFYRADIIIEKIADAKDAFQRLSNQKLTESNWLDIGHCIRRFHNAGIYHADLNIHNIMLTEGGDVWLIDFDRAEQKACKKQWQVANLERLKRSLNKEKTKNPNFHFSPEDWNVLLNGYTN